MQPERLNKESASLRRNFQLLHRVAAEQQQILAVGQQCLRAGVKVLAPLLGAGCIKALHGVIGQQIEQVPRPDDRICRRDSGTELDVQVLSSVTA